VTGRPAPYARAVWEALETCHAVVYFAPEVRDALRAAGMAGFWMGYFAGRAAPLGAVGPGPVTALFYNFHPEMVRRALPEAWRRATPEAVLYARLHAVDAALWRLWGDEVRAVELVPIAQLARRAAEAVDVGGRPLAAAHLDLDWPTVAHLSLWHAATVLREHRGDGHVNVLVNEGVTGLEAHVLAVAAGQSTASIQQVNRRWSEQDWAAAVDGLAERGLLDPSGALTGAGRTLKDRIERRTDELAAAPYRVLDDPEASRLLRHTERLARLVVAGDGIPFPNPMGLTPPREAAR
jgi:hypothetical protein